MGNIVIKDLSKEFIERRSQPRIANSAALFRQGQPIPVLDRIDLEFQDGELVCILGPSGCGKTTLIRIIAGFDRGTSGTVFIDGKEVDGPSSDHIFVFQHNGLLPWLTVWNNVGLGLRNMERPEEKAELIQEYIDAVNLTGFEHHYPHELSGGMQRRAELARALVVNPEVLFMDEPFAGLDFLTRLKMREEVVNMHQLFGKTVIFITHDIDEALVMADRVILFTDRPARVKADHKLEFPTLEIFKVKWNSRNSVETYIPRWACIMLFRIFRQLSRSTAFRVLAIALGWFVLISWLHYQLNFEHSSRPVIRMGYMPVITNLAAPLLDDSGKDGSGLRFEALKFSSFAEMGESLRNGHIHAAFIIAPLSIVLHQQDARVKLVYIGNRHESTLVYRSDLKINTFADLAQKTIAVPMRFSGHNIATRRLAEEFGISGPNLKIIEMNPPDMPSALSSGALDAYFVGEPFAASTVMTGQAKVLYYVEQVWSGFICNLLLVRQDLIDAHPQWVQNLVEGAARSGYWARSHPKEAATIAAKYWNQLPELVEYALRTPPDRIVYDRFVPKYGEMQFLADQMVRFGLLKHGSIDGLIDDRFAKNADLSNITDLKSILNYPRE